MATDAVITKAVSLAREAADQDAPVGTVGEHLGFDSDDDRVVTHYFACLDPAYVGWRWAVVVTRASRARAATVSEVVLLPGEDALIAPAWVPWSERVRPGDLGVGTVWATPADDPRLTAGFTASADLDGVASQSPVHPGQWEIGLGRVRVLSPYGRDVAAERWVEGERGPDSPMARSVSLTCSSCGFLIPIGGPLGQAFGVCAHDMSPADGCVVALNYGCGAHSEIIDTSGPTSTQPSASGDDDHESGDPESSADGADEDPSVDVDSAEVAAE
ncbi:MAG: DUF3027 domain-containing protein [Actinomycetota bacterium]